MRERKNVFPDYRRENCFQRWGDKPGLNWISRGSPPAGKAPYGDSGFSGGGTGLPREQFSQGGENTYVYFFFASTLVLGIYKRKRQKDRTRKQQRDNKKKERGREEAVIS